MKAINQKMKRNLRHLVTIPLLSMSFTTTAWSSQWNKGKLESSHEPSTKPACFKSAGIDQLPKCTEETGFAQFCTERPNLQITYTCHRGQWQISPAVSK